MMRFLLGLIIGVIAVPIAAIVYLVSGRAPIAVADHPFPFERYIAGEALERGIARRAPHRQLASFNENDLMSGAQTYRRGCGCHGLPGEDQNLPRPKMFPSPPQLFTPDGYVTDDPVGVTFWKIKNGIRLSAMPSFNGVLKDDQMWQVAALLANADKLPPNVMDVLKQPLFPPQPANTPPKPVPNTKQGKGTKKKP